MELLTSKLPIEPHTVRQFMTGLTQNQQLFDVVDVGYGKERTDYKIKAMFEAFVHNTGRHFRSSFFFYFTFSVSSARIDMGVACPKDISI